MLRRACLVVMMLLVAAAFTPALAQTPSAMIEEAVYAEETLGDLDKAIGIYRRIIEQADADRDSLAQAHYRLGKCQMLKGQRPQAAATFRKLVQQFPDQESVVASARKLLDSIELPDPASLMPARTMYYMEVGRPGEQVETLVEMLQGTPFANPLAAVGGGGAPDPQQVIVSSPGSPELIMAALLNPSMIDEFKKVRGLAFGIYDVNMQSRSSAAQFVAVLYPGDSDALKGLVKVGLSLIGQPAEPIEGMQVLRFPQAEIGGCAFDDKAFIVASPVDQLDWCVRQYKAVSEEPSLASGNRAFQRLDRDGRQKSALTMWCDTARYFDIISKVLTSSRDMEQLRIIDQFVDFRNNTGIYARLTLDTANPCIDATADLNEGHRCLGYSLIRTPNLSRRALEAVPADAIAVVAFALGEAEGSAAQLDAAQKAVKQVTGLDIGRELFDNIEQVTLFLRPPGKTTGDDVMVRAMGPLMPGLGLVITSRDPEQTRLLLDRLLRTVGVAMGAPEPKGTVGAYRAYTAGYLRNAQGTSWYSMYVAPAGKHTVLTLAEATAQAAVDAAEGRASALTAGPLQAMLANLPPDTSKLILVNAGGAVQAFATQAAAQRALPEPLAKSLAPLSDAFAGTWVELHTAESPNRLQMHLGLRNMPPLGGLFPLFMQLAQASRSGARRTTARLAAPAPPKPVPELHRAASTGDAAKAKALLAGGVAANATDSQGRTALHMAAEGGHAETTKVLIDAGAAVNAADSSGSTALHMAAEGGHLGTVHLLLAAGAAVNAKDASSGTPLHRAATAGHGDTADVLLQAGADPNAVDTEKGWTPLHAAVFEGHEELVGLLVPHGARKDILIGAGLGDWDAVQAELARDSSSIERVDKEGNTVLRWAARANQADMVRRLLERGADPNKANVWGGPPLLYAARSSDTEVAKLLVEHGAQVNFQAQGFGRAALHEAAINGNLELVEFLLAHGADVTLQDGYGLTALAHAKSGGHEDAVQLLLRHQSPQ